MSVPLAERIRPKTLDDIVGQTHLLGENKPLRRIIESGKIPNMIFYGPSGVGKTTVARMIANNANMTMHKLNGTSASIADIKQIVAETETLSGINGILLYLDEIQYLNKKQQQSLLEYIENGKITLIASTTENPYFYVYNAIISRSTVFEFKPLTSEEILPAIKRAFQLMADELGLKLRLENGVLELIASENIVSPAVMAAMGSVLTNKYAEGYSGKRYYGGCQCVDVVEDIAVERACKLFGAKYANVQPHSGAQANTAVYFALLKPGDTVMGMSLDAGGHLTHGSPVNLSGKYFNFVPYGVNDEGYIDYEALYKQANKCRPRLIVAGASAYPRAINFEKLSEIAKAVGAYLMVDMAHIAGLVAAGCHQSPVPYADVVTTTTHKTLRGPRGGLILTNNEYIAKKINSAIFPGTQGGPLMHVIAAKAVCFGEALKPEFKAYGEQIVKNAQALAKGLLDRGFNLVSGGTDNHLMLVDLRPFHITGKEFEKKLDEVYITVNKNAIPNDPEKPFVTSGVRVGTAAVTTRGLVEEDMDVIAECMYLTATDFDNKADEIREKVNAICKKYPLYE